jgi:uncharacterized repeat protein (TIGR01451 family)
VPSGDANKTVINTATVNSPVIDRVSTNNSFDDPTLIIASADLSIKKVTRTPIVRLGETAEFLLTVKNSGPAPAINVVVEDQLPRAFGWQTAAGSGQGWTCVTDASVGKIRCAYTGRIDVGTEAPPIVISALLTQNGTVTNTAKVSGLIPDLVPGNNSASSTVEGIVFFNQPPNDPNYPQIPDPATGITLPSTVPTSLPSGTSTVPGNSSTTATTVAGTTKPGGPTTLSGAQGSATPSTVPTSAPTGKGSTGKVPTTLDPKAKVKSNTSSQDGDAAEAGAGNLSLTGSNSLQLLIAALAMAIVGLGLITMSRRRRN